MVHVTWYNTTVSRWYSVCEYTFIPTVPVSAFPFNSAAMLCSDRLRLWYPVATVSRDVTVHVRTYVHSARARARIRYTAGTCDMQRWCTEHAQPEILDPPLDSLQVFNFLTVEPLVQYLDDGFQRCLYICLLIGKTYCPIDEGKEVYYGSLERLLASL